MRTTITYIVATISALIGLMLFAASNIPWLGSFFIIFGLAVVIRHGRHKKEALEERRHKEMLEVMKQQGQK